MIRHKVKDSQYTFVPEYETEPKAFQPQPNVKEQLFEPDMARFFSLDWKQVKIGRKQWEYHWKEAEAILQHIRDILGAAAEAESHGRIALIPVLPRPEHARWDEFGLAEMWEEYAGAIKPMFAAYPEYLKWFCRRIGLELESVEEKRGAWYDAIRDEAEAAGKDFSSTAEYKDPAFITLRLRILGLTHQMWVVGQVAGISMACETSGNSTGQDFGEGR